MRQSGRGRERCTGGTGGPCPEGGSGLGGVGRRRGVADRLPPRGGGGWGDPGKTFSIGLGCELRHASRLVYSDGL
ncbi:short-chain fatty acyl-CoA regulator family protein, partial [Streptomyces albidoflavus]